MALPLPLLVLLLAAPHVAPIRETRLVMGTTAEVQVGGLGDATRAIDAAFAALARVDDAMSLWKPSELQRLNDGGQARVSPELLGVLQCALEVAGASAGAFDPTVEPFVRASGGFGGEPRRLAKAERERLLRTVGYRRIHLDAASQQVRLDPGTRVDLGGIAKGYAADLALRALQDAGAESGLVDLGGSSLGVFGTPLTVDVRDPESTDAPPWASFRALDAAVSSSGGDQHPRHILDPRTGEPARRVLAATVVASSGVLADALSTAVYVLGAEEGLRLLEGHHVQGLVLLREAGQRVIVTTRGFAAANGLSSAPGVQVRE